VRLETLQQLVDDDFCILRAELTVTNGAPGIVDAQFHSATQWGAPFHQSQITSAAIWLRSGQSCDTTENEI